MRSERCDVAVIGGGPAGSTAASLLAREGWTVTLLERERFPRFHVGESLLPFNVPLLDELGVREEIERVGSVPKHGAVFVTGDGSHAHTFHFRDGIEPGPPSAYQVVRSEFDRILLDACARYGADVRQEHAVTAVERVADQWRVRVEPRGAAGYEIHCPYLVDASGRDTFLAQRSRTRRMVARHRRAALYAHFHGVTRGDGIDAGNIVIVTLDGGWFWLIPLAGDLTSIGLVYDGPALRALGLAPEVALERAMESCPEVRRRTSRARRATEVFATSDYSYTTAAAAGEGWVSAGDAYAFLDPVFSSGVWLAMSGGAKAARAIAGCLAEPRLAARLLARHGRDLERTNARYWRFVDHFYRPGFLDVFMQPAGARLMRRAVNSVLAGTPSRRLGLRLQLALFFLVVRAQRHVRLREPLPRWPAFAPPREG